MKTIALFCLLGASVGLLAGCGSSATSADSTSATTTSSNTTAAAKTDSANEVAVLKTSDGDMVIEFAPDVAPKTVENFKTLAKKGFYDGTAFHRIIKGFMIQGGDPNTKDKTATASYGTGGPGYTIQDEFNDHHHTRGVISMANTGAPNSSGSQFFICLGDVGQLDHHYTVFGKLIKGDDVLGKIGDTTVGPSPSGEPSVPQTRVDLVSVKIVPADSVK